MMFYEKLAEAKQEKKRSGLADTLILGSAVAGGYGAHKGVSGHVDQFIEKRRSKALMDNIAREELLYKINEETPWEQKEFWRRRLSGQSRDEFKRQRAQEIANEAASRQTGIHRRFKRLGKGLKIGSGVVGATAIGYGAKKLYDRFNQRKQQRD